MGKKRVSQRKNGPVDFEYVTLDEYIKIQGDLLTAKQIEDIKAWLKRSGETCSICDNPIWVVGSAIIGQAMCFTCITGEADASEDYEVSDIRKNFQ